LLEVRRSWWFVKADSADHNVVAATHHRAKQPGLSGRIRLDLRKSQGKQSLRFRPVLWDGRSQQSLGLREIVTENCAHELRDQQDQIESFGMDGHNPEVDPRRKRRDRRQYIDCDVELQATVWRPLPIPASPITLSAAPVAILRWEIGRRHDPH